MEREASDLFEDHEARISVLEAHYQNLHLAQQRNYELLCEKIEGLQNAVLRQIDKLDHAVNGNGKIGLVDRVTQIERSCALHESNRIEDRLLVVERRHDAEEGAQKAQDRLFDKMKPFIPYLIAAGWSAFLYTQIKR